MRTERAVTMATMTSRRPLLGAAQHPKLCGDVNNMTLIGQSAGATSCETQIKSPLNKGIFKQAIIQSSAGLASFIKQKPDNTKEYAKWRQVYERTGCKSIEEFKQLPAKTLYDAFAEVSAKSSIGFCNAVYDENFTSGIKNQPARSRSCVQSHPRMSCRFCFIGCVAF